MDVSVVFLSVLLVTAWSVLCAGNVEGAGASYETKLTQLQNTLQEESKELNEWAELIRTMEVIVDDVRQDKLKGIFFLIYLSVHLLNV